MNSSFGWFLFIGKEGSKVFLLWLDRITTFGLSSCEEANLDLLCNTGRFVLFLEEYKRELG